MAGKIPQTFIDQVVQQTDIVDLINGYVELKAKGREYGACCPFHHEKSPSFTVSPDKQFYHCFGCGAHGTAIGFLIEHEGLEFIEAIEQLAARLSLEVPREEGHIETVNKSAQSYELLEQVNQFYQKQLRQHANAIEYLKNRGINGEIAAAFDIGYAPEGFDTSSKAFPQATNAQLEEIGLLSKNDRNHLYDRFRDRIMFPIRDLRGRVIAFGGRTLGDAKPKYINSPETPLFHKSDNLYGLYEARKALGKLSRLIIVEGYMDVVALNQLGFPECVATLGTATTSQHIQRLLRYTPNLLFCFDGDRAGQDAAWKALQQILPVYADNIDIRFAFMPQGDDPDSYVRERGAEAFSAFLKEASTLSAYFFRKLGQEVDISNAEGLAKLASLAKPLIAKIPKTVFRDLMTKELNQRVGTIVSNTGIMREQPAAKTRSNDRGPRYTKTRLAIALLLRDPGLANKALDVEQLSQLLSTPGIALLIEMLEILEQQADLSSVSLLERFRGKPAYEHLIKLLDWDPPDMTNREISFVDTMRQFKKDIERAPFDAFIQDNSPEI
jgi:DNA primase|tara:strand:- start:895 stop:2556 length:1662 start_codon:yes stop_codon:yes gene_type:complete